jgi:hypothetical protein
MVGWNRVLVGCLCLTAMVGCAGRTRPTPASGTGAPKKTIVIGATRLDPPDITIGTADTIAFVSTAGDPLQVEFIQPSAQTGKIDCQVVHPQQLEHGEQAWAEFRMNQAGHLTASVPPGPFQSTCSFAPGSYSYRVRVLDEQMRPLQEKLGQLGSITVK